jgi:hypothetical protein
MCSDIQGYVSEENSSGTRSDPKFGRRGRDVSYIESREKRFRNAVPACVLLRKNYRYGVPARLVTKTQKKCTISWICCHIWSLILFAEVVNS